MEKRVTKGQSQQEETNEQQRLQSLRLANESVQVGRETLAVIAQQSDTMGNVERLVDDEQYMVDQSKYLVRGMTWSGWFSNLWTSVPQPTASALDNDSSKQDVAGFICPDCKQTFRSSTPLVQHYKNNHGPIDEEVEDTLAVSDEEEASKRPPRRKRRPPPAKQKMKKAQEKSEFARQEEFLDQLAPQLSELKEIGHVMGNAIDGQTRQIDRVGRKMEKSADDMRLVTVNASRISSGRHKVKFQFRIAFQEQSTEKYIEAVNGNLRPNSIHISPSAIFRAYTVGEESHDVWGFQNESSRLFVGLTRYGNLRVQGQALKSYERFAIDINKPATTIYAFASYFGSGGWVCMNANKDMYCIRGTSENKAQAARFKVVRIDDGSADKSNGEADGVTPRD